MFHVCALLEIWCNVNVAFQGKSPIGDINRLVIYFVIFNISLHHYHIPTPGFFMLININPISVECINTDFTLKYFQTLLFEN